MSEKKVRDVMTSEVVTASLPGTREDVFGDLMRGDISSVPVTKDGRYRGLVSRRDMLDSPDEEQLSLLMRDVETVTPETTVEDTARTVLDEGERRLPVVEDSEVVGIVTVTDIVRHISETENTDNIDEYAEDDVLTVWEGTPLGTVVNSLRFGGETSACVIDGSDLVGVVSEVDCIRASDTEDVSDTVGVGLADEDDDWMWSGIKSSSSNLVPISRLRFPDDPVSEHMSSEVVKAMRSTDVSVAAERMVENDHEQLPVVRGDSLVGILKDVNLLRAVQ
ncbi:MAG: CBS domain-containing protein [Halobacteria archaeon]|nr:CBS domain-containing protein [Halobacteria archaeon]